MTLNRWIPYSLKERVLILRQTYNLDISHDTLWRFYRDRKVTHVTGKATYRRYINQKDNIDDKRKAFAKLLGNLIRAKKPIIYVDETTFNSWSLKKKSWASSDYEPL